MSLIFRSWEGIWDGTERTTSVAQNPDSFTSFAGISEIWPLNEDRLARKLKFQIMNFNDRQANLRQIKRCIHQIQLVLSTNQNFH